MGQRRPGLLRAGFRRAGSAATPTPPSTGGSSLSLSAEAPYAAPFAFTLSDSSGPALILRQWWYDFSDFSEANLALFLGVEVRRAAAGGNIYPVFGVFLLPDGDVAAATLFHSVLPKLQISLGGPPATTNFHGFNGRATTANLGITRQILLAVRADLNGTTGNTPTDYEWRSSIVKAAGTS